MEYNAFAPWEQCFIFNNAFNGHLSWMCQNMSLSIIICLVCFNFQRFNVFQSLRKCYLSVKQIKRRITRRLIQIQAVCIWHFGCDWRLRFNSNISQNAVYITFNDTCYIDGEIFNHLQD